MQQDEEIIEKPKKKKRKRKRYRRLLTWSAIMLTVLLLFQAVFFFYSDQIFGRVLKEVIKQQSSGLYELSYSKITFNLFANEFRFEDAKIQTDNERFKKLSAQGRVKNTYEVDCKLLEVRGPSLYKLYSKRELKIKSCLVKGPKVKIGFGNAKPESGNILQLQEAIAEQLQLLDANAIKVEDGEVELVTPNGHSTLIKKLGGSIQNLVITTENGKPSLDLGDMQVWLGKNELQTDSATIQFDSIYASSGDSNMLFSHLEITPIEKLQGNQAKLKFDLAQFEGVQFWKLAADRALITRKALIDGGDIEITRVDKQDANKQYELLSKVINTIGIQVVDYQNIGLFYEATGKLAPLHFIAQNATGQFTNFSFDSTSFIERSQHAFSDNLSLDLNHAVLYTTSEKPEFRFDNLNVSTDNKTASMTGLVVASKNRDLKSLDIKSINTTGINVWELANNKSFNVYSLEIKEPRLVATSNSGNKQFNSDEIRNAIKDQFEVFRILDFKITKGDIVLIKPNGGIKSTISDVNLAFQNFDIANTSPGIGNKLLSDEFAILVGDFNYQLPDSQELILSHLSISSIDKYAYLGRLQLVQTPIGNIGTKVDLNRTSARGIDLKRFLKTEELRIKEFEINGVSNIALFRDSSAVNTRFLKSLFVEEARIDSLNITSIHQDSIGKTFVGNSKLQICDLNWNPEDTLKPISTYGIEWFGENFGSISKRGGHAFFANEWLLSSHDKTIVFNNIRVEPLEDGNSEVKAQVFANQLSIVGTKPRKLFEDGVLRADYFKIDNPNLTITDLRTIAEDERRDNLTNPYKSLGNFFELIDIKTLEIQDGSFLLRNQKDSMWNELSAEKIDAFLYDVKIDSNTKMGPQNLFCASSSVIQTTELRQSSKDGEMKYRLGKAYFRPHDQVALIEGFDISNRYLEDDPLHFSVFTKEMGIKGLDYYKFWVEKEVLVDSIFLKESTITTFSGKKENKKEYYESELPEKLTNNFSSWQINSTNFSNATIRLGEQDSLENVHFTTLSGVNGAAKNTSLQHGYRPKFLYSDSLAFELVNYKKEFDDSLNSLTASRILINPINESIQIDSLSYKPLYSATEYSQKIGHQADWINMNGASLTVYGFDTREILYYDRLVADSIILRNASVNIFTDKTLPPRPYEIKPMPQDILRDIPIKMSIAEVQLRDCFVQYEEQHPQGRIPGEIHFEHLNVDVYNVCNDKMMDRIGEANVEISALLMGSSPFTVSLKVPFYDPFDHFEFSGELGEMDMTEINPMLENLAFVSIDTGMAQGLYFNGDANESEATGEMRFYYTNLKVRTADDSTYKQSGVKKAGMNILLKLLVNKNSRAKSLPITGYISYQRDRSKSVFHYGAKALISGILDSIK